MHIQTWLQEREQADSAPACTTIQAPPRTVKHTCEQGLSWKASAAVKVPLIAPPIGIKAVIPGELPH